MTSALIINPQKIESKSSSLLVSTLYTIFLTVTVALPILGVGGIPLRALFGILLLSFLIVSFPKAFYRALTLHKNLVILTIGFALLGAVVSLFNGIPIDRLIRQIVEIHVQTGVNLLLAALVVEICGVRKALFGFLFAIGLSSVFAVAQALNIDFAWTVRLAIRAAQGEVVSDYDYFYNRRPMGLSFSPIVLATQLCLGLAAYLVVRHGQMLINKGRITFDWRIFYAVILFFLVCLASENRSPILGALIFLVLYVARTKKLFFWTVAPMALMAVVVVVPIILDSFQDSDSRIASVDDKSAVGRISLYYYGLRLFLDNPLGYGLAFDPTEHWQKFWAEIQYLPNAGVIQDYPLHNYILSMLNFYGIGLFLLVPYIRRVLRFYKGYLVFFIPYIVHILFHNAGPFWNDNLIWFVLAMAAYLKKQSMSSSEKFRISNPVNHV